MNLKRPKVAKGVVIATRPGAHHLGDFDAVAKIKAERAAKVWALKLKRNPKLKLLEQNNKAKMASGW